MTTKKFYLVRLLRFSFALCFSLLSVKAYSCATGISLNLPQSNINLNSNTHPLVTLNVDRVLLVPSCNYVIGVDRGSSPTYDRKLYLGSETIDFQVYRDATFFTPLKDGSDISSSVEGIFGSFQMWNGFRNTHQFLAFLTPPTGHKTPGVYTDTFTVNLYRIRNNGSFVLEDSSPLVFTYNVMPVAAISLVPSGAPYNPNSMGLLLDFGILSEGMIRQYDAIVVANTNYQLKASSENGGKLVHELAGHETIDYFFHFNGTTFSFDGPNQEVHLVSGTGPTSYEGDRYNGEIEIGSVSQKLAGLYTDIITITVEAY